MRQEAGLLENQASYFREIGERGFVAEFSQFGTGGSSEVPVCLRG